MSEHGPLISSVGGGEQPQLPLTRLPGAPYERGQCYGRHCAKTQAARLAASLVQMRQMRAGLDRHGRAVLARVRATVRATASELASEMEGMADGAELPVEDVMDLNARNAWTCEVTFDAAADEPSCTAVLIGNDGDPVLFKTLDDAVSADVDSAGWQTKIDSMLADVTLACYTSITGAETQFYRQFPLFLGGDIGANHHGLVIGQTSLHPGLLPVPSDGLPHVLVPPLLVERCRNVADVRRELESIRLLAPKGYTINVADAGGEYASFDCTTYGCLEVAPRKGVVFATNHLRHPDFLALPAQRRRPFPTPGYESNSRRRYALLEALLDESPEDDWAWWRLRLLSNGAREILIQPGQATCEGFITIWAAVLRPRERAWTMTVGVPDNLSFAKYRVA